MNSQTREQDVWVPQTLEKSQLGLHLNTIINPTRERKEKEKRTLQMGSILF